MKIICVVGARPNFIKAAPVVEALRKRSGITVAHVEAGLWSFDRTMPEEWNRIVTDHLSEYLFITEPSAQKNLLKEGLPEEKIIYVGNVMVDTLLKHRERAQKLNFAKKLG